jgi:E3 ubiquitin-protein ligase HERC2
MTPTINAGDENDVNRIVCPFPATDAEVKKSVFGQAFEQLKDVPSERLRPARPRGAAPHVTLNVSLVSEKVLGQGGPYRAFFSDISREIRTVTSLHDPYPLNLFVPSGNRLTGMGEARECFIVNPNATSKLALSYYRFFGKLIGMAIRTRVILSFDLASIFWKKLCDQEPGLTDLIETDVNVYLNVIKPIMSCDTADDFHVQSRNVFSFPITNSSNTPVASGPSNSTRTEHATFATSRMYVEQLVQCRLHESDQQVRAVREGLRETLPASFLCLLTGAQLRQRVCGSRDIDLQLLKRHTEYGKGIDSNSAHIRNMWVVLEEFSQEQRRQFVKFAYGQERLPSSDSEFDAYPKIRLLIKAPVLGKNKKVDEILPRADTCFFNLTLPAYSDLATMRKRLTLLLQLDWGMSGDDTDFEEVAMPIPSSMPPPPPSSSSPALVGAQEPVTTGPPRRRRR